MRVWAIPHRIVPCQVRVGFGDKTPAIPFHLTPEFCRSEAHSVALLTNRFSSRRENLSEKIQ